MFAQVWDSLGRLLYQSMPLASAVTALAWSPTSEIFTVGTYNSLLLCHASGWLCSKVCQFSCRSSASVNAAVLASACNSLC